MDNNLCILALVALVVLLLYYHLKSTYGYWERKSIPCPKGVIPGIGHIYPMLFMKRNMADMFRDFYNEMSGHSIIGYYCMQKPCLMVREPELVKTVMSLNFQNFSTNDFAIDKELDPLLAVNPFFSEGDRWKASRSQLASAFTSGKLKYMYESVKSACNELEKYMNQLVEQGGNEKVEFNVKNLFSKYTCEVAASAAFGVEGENFRIDKDGPFTKIGKLLYEPNFFKGITQIVLIFVPFLSKMLKIRFIPLEADQFFRKLVRDVLKVRQEQGIQRPDFLQLMIQYKESGAVEHAFDKEFDDDIITSHAVSFFDDSYETTSITMSFLAYELAAHPEIQDRVREEVTNAVAEHGGLTYEAIQKMTYMDQTFHESMRLFPAFGTLRKVCTQEIELVGSDGIRCKVTPGTTVAIPVSALQRDPQFWPEPEKFDPDNFSEENKKSRPRFVHIPFGEGPRSCPGYRMGMLLMKAAIATIIQRYTLEVSPRTKEPVELDPNYFMSAALGGLWVNFKYLRNAE